jgi:LacI family transcriptional regulator
MNNDKEITIYDIATKLNISPSTVSRSLNDNSLVSKKTRKKVTDLAKKLGYQSNTFASSLRKQRTNTIGVIVPKLNSNFVSTVIAGIEEIANKAGYNLIISQSLEKSE